MSSPTLLGYLKYKLPCRGFFLVLVGTLILTKKKKNNECTRKLFYYKI